MKNYLSNLEARFIKLSQDDLNMLQGIVKRKLAVTDPYPELNGEIKGILENNVLIVATTDNVKRLDNKLDIIISNIDDAIDLVMADAKVGSQLEE